VIGLEKKYTKILFIIFAFLVGGIIYLTLANSNAQIKAPEKESLVLMKDSNNPKVHEDCLEDEKSTQTINDDINGTKHFVEEWDFVEIEYNYENRSGGTATIVGEYRLPEKIETCLVGMILGEEKQFFLTPEEGRTHIYRSISHGRITFYVKGEKTIFKVKVTSIIKSNEIPVEHMGAESMQNLDLRVSENDPALGGDAPRFGEIQFHKYEEGLQEAKIKDKVMFIYFWSASCFWCKKFEGEVLTNTEVVNKLKGYFIPVAVDIDHEKAIVGSYRVSLTPTFIFTDSSGKILNTIFGYRPTEVFLDDLEEALKANSLTTEK
jgi:thioredoxin-related protein